MNKQGNLTVKNANQTIKEIFDVTGFADVLNVVIDNATTIESNVDYLMLLNDPDSAAE